MPKPEVCEAPKSATKQVKATKAGMELWGLIKAIKIMAIAESSITEHEILTIKGSPKRLDNLPDNCAHKEMIKALMAKIIE